MADPRDRSMSRACHQTIALSEGEAGPLWQIATWPEGRERTTDVLSEHLDGQVIERPNRIVRHAGLALWYVAPATWWWRPAAERADHAPPPDALASHAAVTELGAGLREVAIRGRDAGALLSRHVPVRLDDVGMAIDGFARTDIHHVSVAVWRTGDGFAVLVPRSFAASLRELLDETAAQFANA